MDDPTLWEAILRWLASLLVASAALVSWSWNREAPWVWMVIGSALGHVDATIQLLARLGMIDPALGAVQGFPLLLWIPGLVAHGAYFIGFAVMIRRQVREKNLLTLDKTGKAT